MTQGREYNGGGPGRRRAREEEGWRWPTCARRRRGLLVRACFLFVSGRTKRKGAPACAVSIMGRRMRPNKGLFVYTGN